MPFVCHARLQARICLSSFEPPAAPPPSATPQHQPGAPDSSVSTHRLLLWPILAALNTEDVAVAAVAGARARTHAHVAAACHRAPCACPARASAVRAPHVSAPHGRAGTFNAMLPLGARKGQRQGMVVLPPLPEGCWAKPAVPLAEALGDRLEELVLHSRLAGRLHAELRELEGKEAAVGGARVRVRACQGGLGLRLQGLWGCGSGLQRGAVAGCRGGV